MGIFKSFKSPFRKRSGYKDYVIDLGKMRDKGLIQEPAGTDEDVIDLTNSGTSSTADTSTEADSSGLGFLGSLAGAGEDGATPSETESSESSYGSYNSYSTSGATRDVEEKIDSVSDRVYKLIERIDLLEHKISRIEKRTGVSERY